MHLFSDLTSCMRSEANQFRFFLHNMAYVLLHTFCRLHLQHNEWAARPVFDDPLEGSQDQGARAEATDEDQNSSADLTPLEDRLVENLAIVPSLEFDVMSKVPKYTGDDKEGEVCRRGDDESPPHLLRPFRHQKFCLL
jgi:hypothetical protein